MPNMDNNNSQQPQQNGNNKFPKGQFIAMLIAALVTLGVAGMMKSYMGNPGVRRRLPTISLLKRSRTDR